MKEILRFNKITQILIIVGDLCILNFLFELTRWLFCTETLNHDFVKLLPQFHVLLSILYILCYYSDCNLLHDRRVRFDRIITQSFRNTFLHCILFVSLVALANLGTLSLRFLCTFYLCFLASLILYRLLCWYLIRLYRRLGGNSRTVILIGSGEHMEELYREMTRDPTSGFRIAGYFSDNSSMAFSEKLPYLGLPSEVLPYIQQNHVEHVYCAIQPSYSHLISHIASYCEKRLIHFFSIPEGFHYLKNQLYDLCKDRAMSQGTSCNYLKRQMYLGFLGNVPVLSLQREPLSLIENRIVKRAFDIVFSLLFLCTLFPIITIVIGIAIKLTSSGPVFFKQRRSGEDGKEFWCYKFRSMQINAYSDELQATHNDVRVTRLGRFLRQSNMDELPQFINVLLGDMSVVGPRPHMLKHTREFSKLVDKYMVRHLVKPGITGWAQVNGYRGEIKEQWQIEGRVEYDIWYMKNWTFALDLFIIYKTIINAIKGEETAY